MILLFPFMECLFGGSDERRVALRDLSLDLYAGASMVGAGAAQEIGNVRLRVMDGWRATLLPVVGAALHDKMPMTKVLQPLGERLPAVKRLGDLRGVAGRQLEEHMGADREDGRAHFIRVLAEVLIGADHRDAELAGLGEHGFDARVVGKEVLHLVHVHGEERPLRAGEERILIDGKEQASQRERLFAQLAFLKIRDDPIPLVHRFRDRESGSLLPHDVAEGRIGGEGRCLIQDRLPHRCLHRLARLVITALEVLADLRVRRLREAPGAERLVREERGEFQEREAVRGKHVQGIPQQFVRARAEVVQSPTAFQYLRELRDADETRLSRLKRVQADGEFAVCGRDVDRALMELLPELRFARGDGAEKKRSGIAVLVDEEESAPRADILFCYQTNAGAFPAARLSEDHDVHGAARLTQRDAPLGHRFLHNLKSERHAVAINLHAVPPLCAVPQ